MSKPKQVNAELLREKLLAEIDQPIITAAYQDGLIKALEILRSLTVPDTSCDFRNPGWERRKTHGEET